MRKKVLTIASCIRCPYCSAMNGGNVRGFFDITAGAGADARRYLFCRHKDGPRLEGAQARFPIISEQAPRPGINYEPPAWCPLPEEIGYFRAIQRHCLDLANSHARDGDGVRASEAMDIAESIMEYARVMLGVKEP